MLILSGNVGGYNNYNITTTKSATIGGCQWMWVFSSDIGWLINKKNNDRHNRWISMDMGALY